METTDNNQTYEVSLSRAEQPSGAVAINNVRSEFRSKAEANKIRKVKAAEKSYGRGRKIDVKSVKDKKLKRNLTNLEEKYQTATLKAKEAEILLENAGGFLEAEHELVCSHDMGVNDLLCDTNSAGHDRNAHTRSARRTSSAKSTSKSPTRSST